MKLLLDHNLSPALVAVLEPTYSNSRHIRQIGMERATDNDIWNHAKANNFIIVSKDSDFYDLSMVLGHPPKIIWLAIGNCKTSVISKILLERYPDIQAFSEDLELSFLVLA